MYSYQLDQRICDGLEAAGQDCLQQSSVGPIQLAQCESSVGEPQQDPDFVRAAGVVHVTQIQLNGEVVTPPFEADLQATDLGQYVRHSR